MEILKRDTILNKSKNERLIINMEILNVELQDKNQELQYEIDKLKDDNKELKNNILINKEYKNEIKSKIDELKELNNMKDYILDTIKFHHYVLQNSHHRHTFLPKKSVLTQLPELIHSSEFYNLFKQNTEFSIGGFSTDYVINLNILPSNIQKIYLDKVFFLNHVLSHDLVINKNIKEFEFTFMYAWRNNDYHCTENSRCPFQEYQKNDFDYSEIEINNFFNNLNIVKKIFPNASISANINKDSNLNIQLQQYSKECIVKFSANYYSNL
jgi:hypothetical protein